MLSGCRGASIYGIGFPKKFCYRFFKIAFSNLYATVNGPLPPFHGEILVA